MDTVVIDQDSLHLEIGLFTVFLVFELDKCILKTVARTLIPDHLTREYWSEATENQVEVLI